MYIPDHQPIVKKLISTEGRFQYENGKPFSGVEYVEFTNGDKYEVPKSDLVDGDFRKAKKIIAPSDLVNYASLLDFKKIYIPKRPENRLTISRYFAKNKSTGKITEIDYFTYSKVFSFSLNSHIEVASLTWHISGPPYDSKTLNIFEEGTINKNMREVELLSKRFSGIDKYVVDFKFLADPKYSEMTEPQDNLDKIVLPSPA